MDRTMPYSVTTMYFSEAAPLQFAARVSHLVRPLTTGSGR